MLDGIRWYCPNKDCQKIVYEKFFQLVDLGTQIKEAILQFDDDLEKRTCKHCGTIATSKPVTV